MRLLLAAALLAGSAQEDLVRKIVPDAEKVKKTARKPVRERIEKALGEKLEAADLATPVWECYAVVPTISSADKTLLRVVSASVAGPKGPIKVGVAVAVPESTVHRVVVLENGDAKEIEDRRFLRQFEGFEYTASLYEGAEVLQAALKKADVALRMSAGMREMQVVYERLIERLEKKDKGAIGDAAALEGLIDASLKLLPEAAFLDAARAEKFRGFGAVGRRLLGEAKVLAEGGKFEEAYRKAGELEGQSCARCHGAYGRIFREERLARKLGNGHFSTSLDLGAPLRTSTASYDALGKAVRKALLLAVEAK